MMLKQWKCMVMVVFALLLSACNAEDDSQSSSYQPSGNTEAPIALDNFSQVLLTQEKTVSLEQSVLDPQGLPVYLTNVVSLSDNCVDPSFDSEALTFEIDKDAPDTCYYRYTVKNVSADDSESKISTADSYVLVADTEVSDFLPPISTVTTVGTSVPIDLNVELAAVANIDQYVLDSETMLLGEGSVSAVDTTNNIITYDAPDVNGVARILYSMTSGTGTVKQVGYIDVSISREQNSAPVAGDFQAPTDDAGDIVGITSNEEITIDVIDNIFDPDGDDLQLTRVSSFNSQAEIVDPDSLTNTEFTFRAFAPGDYSISYSVTDNRGGWATGIVQVKVDKLGQTWQDITLDDGTFYTAPWDEESASIAKLDYTGSYSESIDGDDYSIVTFDWETANNYCLSKSQLLPDRTLLTKLYTDRTDIKGTDLWPTGELYWSREEVQQGGTLMHYAVNLADGSEELRDTPAIVTCVNPATLEIERITPQDGIYQTVSQDNIQFHNFSAQLIPSGTSSAPIEGQQIYAYSFDDGVFFETGVGITDSNGYVEFNVASTLAGDREIYFRYQSVNEQSVTFNQEVLESFYLDATSSFITPDTEAQLNAYGVFESSANEYIVDPTLFTWDSSDSIVTVDEQGIVSGSEIAEATITATYTGAMSASANQTDTIDVRIVDLVPEGDLDGYNVRMIDDDEAIDSIEELQSGFYMVTYNDVVSGDRDFSVDLINTLDEIEVLSYDTEVLDSSGSNAAYSRYFECKKNQSSWPATGMIEVTNLGNNEPGEPFIEPGSQEATIYIICARSF